MRISAVFLDAEASKRSSPPSGMAWMALTTTLRRACLKRSLSTVTSTPAAAKASGVASAGGGGVKMGEGFHDAVEAQDFAGDDLHLRFDGGVAARELAAGDFDVEEDGVQRILDFVGDAAGDAADGGEAVRGLELVADLALGFGIAQADDETGTGIGSAGLSFEEVDGEQHGGALRRAGERDAAVANVDAGGGGFVDEKAEVGGRWEDFGDGLAGESGAVAAEEFIDRAGSEDQAAFAVEDEDGIFEIAQQAVHVAAEVGDFELRAAQAFAQEADLGGHDGDFVVGRRAGGGFGRRVVAGCEQVELAAQAAQRPEGEGGKQEGDADGADDGNERDIGALGQSRLDGIANEGGGHDDAHKEWRRPQFLLDLEVTGVAAQQHA